MLAPRLSVCIPAHAAAFPLLRRTLLSFAAQTNRDFEVVVAIDGPGQFRVPDVPYPLAFIRTPRTDSPLPHRNHARNAAAKVAAGELLWFVDADFLWDAHTVEHLLQADHTPLSPILVSTRRYRLGRGVVVEETPEPMPEGFPLVRKADFVGFDERFLGRGGNKESFVTTLQDYRLLASARGYHQPHHRETQPEALTDHNRDMYEAAGGKVWR